MVGAAAVGVQDALAPVVGVTGVGSSVVGALVVGAGPGVVTEGLSLVY